MDDILFTDNDIGGIGEAKLYMYFQFTLKDIPKPKHFLGIEFAYEGERIFLL